MGNYEISIKRSAAKELEAVEPRAVRALIVSRIRALAKDPRPPGSEKLAGTTDAYRIRQGSYRIVYSVDDRSVVIEVVRIAHRREVYR